MGEEVPFLDLNQKHGVFEKLKDMSRLGRNYLQVGMYTEMIFPQKGVRFIAINDVLDMSKIEAGKTVFKYSDFSILDLVQEII